MAVPHKRYSDEFKRQAAARVVANPDQISTIARELGISRSALYDWRTQYGSPVSSPLPEGEGAGVRAAVEPSAADPDLAAQDQRLHQALLDTAFALTAAIRETTDSAPLNQLSAALGLVIDRLLRLESAHPTATTATEEVIQIAYLYPDGSEHSSPPWAEGDPAFEAPIQRGRVRSPFWEDGDSEDDDSGDGPARG